MFNINKIILTLKENANKDFLSAMSLVLISIGIFLVSIEFILMNYNWAIFRGIILTFTIPYLYGLYIVNKSKEKS